MSIRNGALTALHQSGKCWQVQATCEMLALGANHTDAQSRIVIEKNSTQGCRSGLLADSVIMADNLATVELAAIDRVIGSVAMVEIDDALRYTLGL